MQLHVVVHTAFITLALGIPSIVPRIIDNIAENVILPNDFEDPYAYLEMADKTVSDDPKTGDDIIQPTPVFGVADSDTISIPKFHLCFDQNHKPISFWRICGYRKKDKQNFICNGWEMNCKPGYLKTGKDGKEEVCDNDSNCTEHWLEPLQSLN